MLRYVIKRILCMLPVLIGVIVIIFSLMYITPGDPAVAVLGENTSQEALEQVREELGLNKGYFYRLGKYFSDLFLHGDLGVSYKSKRPVLDEILSRYPTTLKLAFFSVLFAMVVGISIGVISAVRQYSILDNICVAISLFGVSAPIFWIAMMLVLIFSVHLGLLPPTGSYGIQYWIMPVFAVGMQSGAKIMRMTRSSMLEVVRQDYVRTAKAKGQTAFLTIMHHAFRNALVPIATQVGLQICGSLEGSVMIETVFALPGLGKYVVDSVTNKDYPAVMGTVLFIGLNCVIINLLVDIFYAFVDPRIKSVYSRKSTLKRVKSNA